MLMSIILMFVISWFTGEMQHNSTKSISNRGMYLDADVDS